MLYCKQSLDYSNKIVTVMPSRNSFSVTKCYTTATSTDLDRRTTMSSAGHVVITIAWEMTRTYREVNLRPLYISGRDAQFQNAFSFISMITY